VVTKDTYGGTGESIRRGSVVGWPDEVTAVEVPLQFRNVVYGVAIVAALGGCADQATVKNTTPGVRMPATPPAWREPASYKFTLTSSCGSGALVGTFQSVVQNGLVVQNTGLDKPARKALSLHLSHLVPTLGQIQAEVDSARNQGADEVVIDHDATDGHPTKVRIDPKTATKGDEYCYQISNYSVG
jgi:hypothetical protein